MNRPSTPALAIAVAAGVANVAVIATLYDRFGYPVLESAPELAVFALTAFAVGFVPAVLTAHTRVLAPALAFVATLAGTAWLEITSPAPAWSQLGDYTVVDGPTHALSYASAWYLWLALFLLVGVVEFGIRRGYEVGDDRLRHLPRAPLARRALALTVGVVALAFGLAVYLLAARAGVIPWLIGPVLGAFAAAVTGVPLVALLRDRALSPIALFALWVPYAVVLEVFTTTDSPVHLLTFGPYALALGVAWLVEVRLRERLGGRNGERFDPRSSPE